MLSPDPPLHPDVAHLAPLLGEWSGTGHGTYPTVAPFDYVETVRFGHVGKPFLTYEQRTRHALDGAPSHAESGYLRPAGPGRAELVLAQPSGVVEVDEGTVEATGATLQLVLRSRLVGLATTAKEVRSVERTLTVDGDVLRTSLSMAAVGQPLTHHVAAELRRRR